MIVLQGAFRIRIISVEFPANTRIRRRRILRNLSSISAVSSALLPPRSITPPPRRAFNRITARRSTSPPRRRAKEIVLPSDRFCSVVSAYYCDIVMNTFVCLSVRHDISGATRAIFTKFLCMLPVAVARSSSGRMTKSQGKGGNFGVFLPTDNAL